MKKKEERILKWLKTHPERHNGVGNSHDGYWGREECDWNKSWEEIFDIETCRDLESRGLIVSHEFYPGSKKEELKFAMAHSVRAL